MPTDLDLALNKVRPSYVSDIIKHMRGTGISLYVHGAPGISKSAVARQVADELDIAFIDFRLTSVAPEDIRGVPFVETIGGMRGLIWTPPLVFPRDLDLVEIVDVHETEIVKFYNPIGNNSIPYCTNPDIRVKAVEAGKNARLIEKKPNHFVVIVTDADDRLTSGKVLWTITGKSEAILGLEEFNSAPPNVMAAAYQLVLDRRIGDYVVPDGVMILAMGNRDGDKGLTYKLLKPVANRFDHIEMEVNHEDWQKWAVLNGMHSDVVGYLAKWTSHLFDEDFANHPENSFRSPRTWEFVSRIVSKPGPPHVIKPEVCGAIGNVGGTAFLQHREFMEDMPNVQRIFDGSVTAFNPKDNKFRTQIAYSTCVQMGYELKKESDVVDKKYRGDRLRIDSSPERKKWADRADRAIGYALRNFTPEVMIMFHKMAMKIYELRFDQKNMEEFKKFAKEYKDMII
jgi:MoxR-like ATPase